MAHPPTSSELLEQYHIALDDFVLRSSEAGLQRAYEVGRRALDEGLGILDLASLYQESLATLLDSSLPLPRLRAMANAAARFFAETLAPFEMTHRSYRGAYEELRASEDRYRDLVENANDVIFSMDLDGTFTSVNPAGERLTGYSWGEPSAMNMAQIVAPEYLPLARRMLDHKMVKGGATTYELEILDRDSRRIAVEVSTRLIYRDRKPIGLQGIARDISERKRSAEGARRLNEALEQQAKRIAHALHDESGQLLASVYIALEEAARDLPATAAQRLHKVKLLLDQIEEQLRACSHELRPTVLDDLGLVPALEFLTQRLLQRAKIPVLIECDTSERFPAALETAVYRIVQEALNNVAKHSKASCVSVRLQTRGHLIHCSIKDDGTGFDIESEYTKKGKRGLGLLGIQSRLDALGGTLLIDSGPGGTDLQVSIPLDVPNVTSPAVG